MLGAPPPRSGVWPRFSRTRTWELAEAFPFSITSPLPLHFFPSKCSCRETTSDRLTADRTPLERPRFHAICPSSYSMPLHQKETEGGDRRQHQVKRVLETNGPPRVFQAPPLNAGAIEFFLCCHVKITSPWNLLPSQDPGRSGDSPCSVRCTPDTVLLTERRSRDSEPPITLPPCSSLGT